uniref:Odorant receptor n=1 Tax=Streltzoviella insularis TaxID=1206366 RepID=A0A7D5YVK9_9NEOP|nr:odorant receptor 25 [Streltzoviella insularis]
MKILVDNANLSISLSLTALKLVGFWAPDGLNGISKFLYNCYALFSFMFLLGTYLIIQVVDLYFVWGNLPLMTGTAFLLFTNLAQAAKIINILSRKRLIQKIITEADLVLKGQQTEEGRIIVKNCNRETSLQQLLYFCLTTVTVSGWAGSAEKNQLPLRAWYPYDTSKSPAYELTYMHQVGALFIAAYLNVGKDTLVTALIAQCRCRLRLLGLALRTLCRDVEVTHNHLLTANEEQVVSSRLRNCVCQHQAALTAASELQTCFSAPTFAQFTVSLVIICVTAFQLASVSHTGNLVRLFSMGTYLLNMSFQVFLYCYQGNQLSEESIEIAGAAYFAPWYAFSARLRRAMLVLMTRSRRVARLTAGGFTTLSLTSFMAIIKASYSFFTVLQQVEEKA